MSDKLQRLKSQIELLNKLCETPIVFDPEVDPVTQVEQITSKLTDEIEASKSALSSCKQSEGLELQQLIDHTPSITYASVASGDFRITYINKMVTKILGHTVSEVLDDPDFWFNHIHPDDRMTMFSRLPFLWEEKRQHYDLRFQKKDASYLWMHATLRTVEDEETGETSLIIGSLTDISRRKEFEVQLKEREQSYRLMLESSRVIPWELELPSMRPSYIGPQVEQVFGLPHEVCNQASFWVEHLHPEDKEKTMQILSNPENLEGDLDIKYRMIKGNGDVIWIRDLFSKKEDEEGNQRLQGVMIDITEQKLLENSLNKEKAEQEVLIKELKSAQAQLLQSEKMASIGSLAAGVAHEINNPIGFINSNLGSLRKYIDQLLGLISKYSDAEPSIKNSPEVLETINNYKEEIDIDFIEEDIIPLLDESVEGLERVKNIVIDLKTFSHMDRAEWEEVDLHKGLDSTLNVAHNEIKYKAEVTKDYGDLPPVECMPSQINQVFMNTLVNAAQAMNDFGEIHITTRLVDDMVCVSIKDSGKGIKEEDMKHLFDPFFTTKPVGEGTGLGLSLSYGIIDSHHGEIKVESQIGEGTQFHIWLPISQKKFSLEEETNDEQAELEV